MRRRAPWWLLVVVLAAGCAQQGRPTGGPPDTTPPTVLATQPASESVGVGRAARIKISFSEPIEAESFAKSLDVAPLLPVRPEFDWSDGGRTVTLRWPDSLKPDATYRITVGTGTTDRHKNAFASATTFAFSTGERLDRGRLIGRVLPGDRKSGAVRSFSIFAYAVSAVTDTFWRDAPEYLTTSSRGSEDESAGWFDLPFLRDGTYRLLAVSDKNGNRKLDPGESFGLPVSDPTVTGSDPRDTLLIFTQFYDTAEFCLSYGSGGDAGELVLTFTHALDTNDWMQGTIVVADAEAGDTIAVERLGPDFLQPAELTLIGDAFLAGRRYRVTASGFHDYRGLPLCDDAICAATIRRIADTTGPLVTSVHLPGIRKGRTPLDPILFQFGEAVDTNRAAQMLSVADTAGTTVAGTVAWPDSRTLVFRPDGSWPESGKLTVTIDSLALYDPLGNRAPTQLSEWTFRPLTVSDLGEIEGRVVSPGTDSVQCVFEFTRISGTLIVTRTVPAPGDFAFSLPAGEWVLEAYLDLDRDNRFAPSVLSPLTFPEPRVLYADTLTIRPRFTLEEIVIQF